MTFGLFLLSFVPCFLLSNRREGAKEASLKRVDIALIHASL